MGAAGAGRARRGCGWPALRTGLLVGLLVGARADGAESSPPVAGAVLVAAAASLTEAFRAAGAAFAAAHPEVTVHFTFAGSSTLVQQIEQGAPVDVYASADDANMERPRRAGLLATAPVPFARNQLTIIVPPGNPHRIGSLADLGRRDLVLALCAPAVPAGRYAREAFAKAGVAVPEASGETDVRAVVTRVSLGEADAGIVYVTDAHAAGTRVEAVPIPDAHNVVARYPIAVLKAAPNAAAGAAFVRFVLARSGQEILTRFGFLPAAPVDGS